MDTRQEPIDRARQLWEAGSDPAAWGEETIPSDSLIWKAEHPRQVQDLYSIGHLLGLPVKVVGSHTSKSVELPVGLFRAKVVNEEEVFLFVRNNFHDLKVVVVSTCPIEDARYSVLHQHWTQAGETLLRHEGDIYCCGSTFAGYYQGIDDLLPKETFVRYEHGRRCFSVQVPGNVVRQMAVIQEVVVSAHGFVQRRRTRKSEITETQVERNEIRDQFKLARDAERELRKQIGQLNAHVKELEAAVAKQRKETLREIIEAQIITLKRRLDRLDRT